MFAASDYSDPLAALPKSVTGYSGVFNGREKDTVTVPVIVPSRARDLGPATRFMRVRRPAPHSLAFALVAVPVGARA